jgi:hypothetical protein
MLTAVSEKVSVLQLWELIHEKKATAVSVWGDLEAVQGRLQLKVSGTKDTLPLVADPKNPAAYREAVKKPGQIVTAQGVMVPGKDLKAPVPLQVGQVKQRD